MQESFLDTEAIERTRAVLSGTNFDADSYAAKRFLAAAEARQKRLYLLVARLATMPDAGAGAGVLPANAPVNLLVPRNGVARRTIVYGAITDAQRSTALFNIARRRNLPEDVYQQTMLSTPQRALYLAGDMLHAALRVGPSDWQWWPEPEILEKGEPLNLTGQGDGVNSDVSKCYFVCYGEQEYSPDTPDGRLTETEQREITRQIQTREQESGAIVLNVDYTDPSTYTEVPLPQVQRYSLLLGFASASATGAATFLRWSTVDIQDERGQKLSNEPIPIGALCTYPFDSSNTQVFYRKLRTPLLIRPGDWNRLQLTFAKRAATGGGDYPANVTADTVGKIVAIIKTV